MWPRRATALFFPLNLCAGRVAPSQESDGGGLLGVRPASHCHNAAACSVAGRGSPWLTSRPSLGPCAAGVLLTVVESCVVVHPLLPNMASGAEGHGFFAGFGALQADADVIHMYDSASGTYVAHDSASMRPAAVFDVKHSDVCEVPPRPTPFMQGHSRVHSFHPSPHINSTSPYAGTDAGAWPHPLPPQPPGSVHRVQPQHMAFAHSSSPAGVLHPNAAQGARYYGALPFGSPPPPCLDPFQGQASDSQGGLSPRDAAVVLTEQVLYYTPRINVFQRNCQTIDNNNNQRDVSLGPEASARALSALVAEQLP